MICRTLSSAFSLTKTNILYSWFFFLLLLLLLLPVLPCLKERRGVKWMGWIWNTLSQKLNTCDQLFLLNCDFDSQACISLMFIYLGRCLIPTSKPTDILKEPNKTQNLKVFAMFAITYGINGSHNFVHCSHPSVEIFRWHCVFHLNKFLPLCRTSHWTKYCATS